MTHTPLTNIILAHRCNPDQVANMDDWHSIVWGNPKEGLLGRQSYAAREFFRSLDRGDDPYIFLGRGHPVCGGPIEEARFTFDYVLERLGEVPGYTKAHEREYRQRVIFDDTISDNTKGEIRQCAIHALAHDAHAVTVVTSPYHLPRALKEALLVGERYMAHHCNRPIPFRILAEPCHTNPPGCSLEETQIVEPRLPGLRGHTRAHQV